MPTEEFMDNNRLERLEEKIDKLIETVSSSIRDGAVHSAVCDSDRANLNKGQAKIWKVLVYAATAGGGSGFLLQKIIPLFTS